MLCVAALFAVAGLILTPPSGETLRSVDWKTLCTLFILLSILDGFKTENLFLPVIRLSSRIRGLTGLSLFLVFGVFFSSMFVTNDISLIIFVPLAIILFRARGCERYILPVICVQNVAAVRGSLLTPFGSPQNLYLFEQSGIGAAEFISMMLPLWVGSAVMIFLFVVIMFAVERRRFRDRSATVESAERTNGNAFRSLPEESDSWDSSRRRQRAVYLALFAVAVGMIVTRTRFWPWISSGVVVLLFLNDRTLFKRVDYALIGTFFCFFVFSGSVSANPSVSAVLSNRVAGHEYAWSILISQVVSNVPAAILLWPFSENLRPLIWGLDTAGLVSVIGSLASVINMRLYTREYPGRGWVFVGVFEAVSLMFFAVMCPLQAILLR